MTKRLYKSKTNKMIAGVCGGIGEYFDIDPVLIRLIYLLATVFTGLAPGVLCYIIAMIIVPDPSTTHPMETTYEQQTGTNEPTEI